METGRLEVFKGPMFSNKTSNLILRVTELSYPNHTCLFFNHSFDQRQTEFNDGIVSSHNGSFGSLPKRIMTKKVMTVEEIQKILEEEDLKEFKNTGHRINYIAIDEVQFFKEEIIKLINKWVDEEYRHVIVAGLNSDFNRNKFGYLEDICRYADVITNCAVRCRDCQTENGPRDQTLALFTARKISSNEQVLAGGDEAYISVCRLHYNRRNKHQ